LFFYALGIGSFFGRAEKDDKVKENAGSASSSGPTSPVSNDRDTETQEVIVLDNKNLTENTSDKENEPHNEKAGSESDKADSERQTSGPRTKASGKQKSCVSGKSLNAASTKKKRRVVLDDSSDEDWIEYLFFISDDGTIHIISLPGNITITYIHCDVVDGLNMVYFLKI